jgi:hypothetical protein
MAKKNEIKLPPTIEGKARKYLKLRQVIARATKLKEALSEPLEKALSVKPDRSMECGTATLYLSDVTRENFNRKLATETLGEEALQPFVEEVTSTQIRVK